MLTSADDNELADCKDEQEIESENANEKALKEKINQRNGRKSVAKKTEK